MYSYTWDEETGGLLLNTTPLAFSKEPRPVYYKELDLLGFDKHWHYAKDDSYPYMWAEANNYYYRGRLVAKTKGGSLYTAPELILMEEPEPDGGMLRFVDVPRMVQKNKEIMDSLVQESIKKVYNTYVNYRKKVDVFHVSYSGGKDSEVTLDIVQKALPHDEFKVVFGDTKMEFPDTYKAVGNVKKVCNNLHIEFYEAKAKLEPQKSWRLFGPPSSALRWCCSVHKTAPQLLMLREIIGKPNVKDMAFVGVRANESIRRSGYDYISFGSKHSGQYSFNPLLEWNSAEVYLYIFSNGLYLNECYKKGSSRAGCLFCPMSIEKSDFINSRLYKNETGSFVNIVKELYSERDSAKLSLSYLENKGWKARKNGRDLTVGMNDFLEKNCDGKHVIICRNSNSWKEWFKTIGMLVIDGKKWRVNVSDDVFFNFSIRDIGEGYVSFVFEECDVHNNVVAFRKIRNILKKCHTCVGCQLCAANCPYGNIEFLVDGVHVKDTCTKCGLCNRLENGCLVYSCLVLPKGDGKFMKKSIDEYGTHPVQMRWVEEFVKMGDDFETDNTLGSAMVPMFKKFLRNAGIQKDEGNSLRSLLSRSGLTESYVWAIMFVNLSYSPCVGWLVRNLYFGNEYRQSEIKDKISMVLQSKTGPGNVANAYRKMSDLPFANMGFGRVTFVDKFGYRFIRSPWLDPDPRVILYSLYKFAEACDGYYQFTVTYLMDTSIERNGISPSEIFGIEKDDLIKILNGLSVNYHEFISVKFTHDLDTIVLNGDKKALDVLQLF